MVSLETTSCNLPVLLTGGGWPGPQVPMLIRETVAIDKKSVLVAGLGRWGELLISWVRVTWDAERVPRAP